MSFDIFMAKTAFTRSVLGRNLADNLTVVGLLRKARAKFFGDFDGKKRQDKIFLKHGSRDTNPNEAHYFSREISQNYQRVFHQMRSHPHQKQRAAFN